MGSLGTRLNRDCNGMGDAAKNSPRVFFSCTRNSTLSLLIIRDCHEMGDSNNISPGVPLICGQNAYIALLMIQIIPSHQIYMAIDNPLFVPSVSCLTTSSYLCNDLRAGDNISCADNFASNDCR